MKDKSILSVLHVAYGSSVLVIVALFAMSSVCAKQTASRGTAAATGGTTTTTTRRSGGSPVNKPVAAGWQLAAELLQENVPWDKTGPVQKKYQDAIDQKKLTAEQNTWLLKAYADKLAYQQQFGLQQPASYWQAQLQMMQQPQPSFSPIQAAVGLQMAGSQAMESGKSYWDWGKEKVWNFFGGSYVSGMGGYKYVAPLALGLAAGPVGLLAGSTAALMTGASAAAILGFSSIMDRTNFMALSGGHASTEGWLKTLKEQLHFILNNEAAYPYYWSKQEALDSPLELYPTAGDPTGVIRQAHNALLQECQAKIAELSPTEMAEEEAFKKEVMAIRVANQYNTLAPDAYIAKLKAAGLVHAQALVSEYNRILNRKNVQEIMSGLKKQPPVPQGQAPMQFVPQGQFIPQPQGQFTPQQQQPATGEQPVQLLSNPPAEGPVGEEVVSLG